MRIESITNVPGDSVKIERTGVKSAALAQASISWDREVTQPRKSLKKETRSAEEIKKDLDAINNQLMNRSIQFSIDESSHDIVVRIVDKETGEVIRELPPESVIRLHEYMAEMSGLLFEEEV